MCKELVMACLRCIALGMMYAIGKQGAQCRNNEYEFDISIDFRALNPDMCVDYFTESDSLLEPWEYSRRIPRNMSITKKYMPWTTEPDAVTPTSSTKIHTTAHAEWTTDTVSTRSTLITNIDTTFSPVTTEIQKKRRRSGKKRKTSFSYTVDRTTPSTTGTSTDLNENNNTDFGMDITTPLPETNNTDTEGEITITANMGMVIAFVTLAVVSIFFGLLIWRIWLKKRKYRTAQAGSGYSVASDCGTELMEFNKARNSLYAIPEEQEQICEYLS